GRRPISSARPTTSSTRLNAPAGIAWWLSSPVPHLFLISCWRIQYRSGSIHPVPTCGAAWAILTPAHCLATNIPPSLLPASIPTLSVLDRLCDHACHGYSRREFLRLGGLSLFGGVSLPGLLGTRAQAANGYGSGRTVTGKSVILLFLQG